jgi:hypothetical protein
MPFPSPRAGHGNAVSLQLIGRWLHISFRNTNYFGVGKRHCRVLYIIPAQPELI